LRATPFGKDEELISNGVIRRLSNIVPAIVLASGIQLVPHLSETIVAIVRNVSNAFIVLAVAMAVSAALNVVGILYNRRPEARLKPIKGYLQVLKIVVYAIAAILMIAIIIDRSPLILLSGLGAMAAVLMLVFQDTLLSLVASVQLSSSDMVRVGDWIEMPHLNADGDVIEIALHTVKVQNWDKTITTLPTRKLITDPMKNWRGMQEWGGRRIKRSLFIDQSTIGFLGPDDFERLRGIGLLTDYLDQKERELVEWNGRLGEKAAIAANTRRLTNIGTFRAYVGAYLKNHSGIHPGMTLLVRQLNPTPNGLPIEIYGFANDTAWAVYEGIQSDIFDHLYAILPDFGLRAFQAPSGRDIAAFVAETQSQDRRVA
jgi:miniconductance mechanosensitive channel